MHPRGLFFQKVSGVEVFLYVNKSYVFIAVTFCSTDPVTKLINPTRKPPSHVFPLPRGSPLSPLEQDQTMKTGAFIVVLLLVIKAAQSEEVLHCQRGTLLLNYCHWNSQLLWQRLPLDLSQDPDGDDYVNSADLHIYGNVWKNWFVRF